MKRKDCDRPMAYLNQLGVKQIDYVVISHYHSDHIGCIPDVLRQFPVQKDVLDRGASYPGRTYVAYIEISQDAALINFRVNLPEPLTVAMTDELRRFLDDGEIFRNIGGNGARVIPLSLLPPA